MARRKVLSFDGLGSWLARFRSIEPHRSPEIESVRRSLGDRVAQAAEVPVVLSPLPAAPSSPAPEPAPPPRPPPRMLRIVGDQLFEVGQDGKLWLAGDDGRQEESILSKWKKMRDSEINFNYDAGKEWKRGQGN